MKLDDYRSYDALGLAELVRKGDVTADELLDTALAAIERRGPSLNAFVGVYEDQARSAIQSGLPDGPFRGVPFSIKDLVTDVAGLPTGNGSRLFAGNLPDHDSEIVRRYRQAGLVVLAKTNTPELGLAPTTEPAVTGATHNPWNLDMSPGGSSGGAAASVAAGIFPMAHASDGGGSIRIPSAYCGLFGLKPTRARMSLGPDRGDGWSGMSCQHVVSRSVRDSATALDATAGYVPGDPYTAPTPTGTFLEATRREPGKLRLGLILDAPTGASVDDAVKEAARQTAEKLATLGHEIVPVTWPLSTADLGPTSGAIIPAHIAATVDARLAELGRPQQPDDIEAVTAMMVDAGRGMPATKYIQGIAAMHGIGRKLAALLTDLDGLITPTVGRARQPLGVLTGDNPERFVREVSPIAAFTSLANVTGQPAMSVPLSTAGDGFPLGTQIIGRYGDEATLLSVAAQLEAAYPWFDRVPS
jgi:Asp-tRNA(Asn)/Glu-tRNA(Gln) amidotransferase A subunit family amidase